MPSKRWNSGGRTGYDGLFGDSFFSDCWDIVDRTGYSRKQRHIVKEDVAGDVPEERVKPWLRKTNLSRMNDEDVYQVMLDVSSFKPSELSVKLVNDKTIFVDGKHSERADPDGFVAREFTRKYNIPDSVTPSSVECLLSKDGVLVIRGHAPRAELLSARPYSPFGKLGEPLRTTPNEHNSNTIPIFTQGYETSRNKNERFQSSNQSHSERIIPITHENGHGKGADHSFENNTIGVKDNSVSSGRSSQTSNRGTSPSLKDYVYVEEKSHGRSRTVSFNDDDTIASNSPIIEEPLSTASNTTTPEPSSSKKLPPLIRQNNIFGEDSFSEIRSSSRKSEERYERSQSPSNPHSHLNLADKHNGDRLHLSTFDFDHGRKSPLEDFDELIRKQRHISRENLEKMQEETDRFLQTVKARSPLFHHKINEDVFDSALKKFHYPIMPLNSNIPPKSKEEKYEKKVEKGYDKNGNWTERHEEKMFSQHYSTFGSAKPKEMLTNRAPEHQIFKE